MANIITAGNSTNGGTQIVTDTSGTLNIVTGSGSGSTAISIDTSQSTTLNSAASTAPFIAKINGTESARIDSSGNLLVGTASAAANEKLNITGSVTSYVTRNINSNASPVGVLISYSAASPNLAGNEFIVCSDYSATRMTLRSNGGIVNYQANNVNLSDRREKTNFAPAGNYLSKICAIPVQTFNYIDQNLEEDDGLTLGVVAQDVQDIAPELVTETDWGTKDDPKMRLSVYQTDLQYALMKCIQELKAELDAVKAKVGA